MKELIKNYKEIPRATRFWNNLFILFALILPFINLDLAFLGAFCGSLLFLGQIMDGYNKNDQNYWWIITPLFLIAVITGCVTWFLETIYNKIITPFNNWLNQKNK